MAEALINLEDDVDCYDNEETKDPNVPVSHPDIAVRSKTNAEEARLELLDCPICLQISVHPCKLPCGHIFCFLCVKGLKNRRCAMCRQEFPTEYLEMPDLILANSSNDVCNANDTNEYQWFYRGRNGWWQYDQRTCQDIEDAYNSGEKHCTILVAGYVYIVDFAQMLQQRQNDPSRKRQVKRDLASVPKKGVAGLRIAPNVSTSTSTDDSDHQCNSASSTNNLIATITATDAAVRIASDIIDSTLAHADEYRTPRVLPTDGSPTNRNILQGIPVANARREWLDQVEETLNISAANNVDNNVDVVVDDNRLELTLQDFRRLSLHPRASDTDSDSENENVSHTNRSSI